MSNNTVIALPGARQAAPAGMATSQATVVEQSRAVAEVQAAVVVAQSNPRDIDRAVADMRDTCGRLPVASRAFYAVPNRGQGLSVHLMRELARIWGNTDYGVRELRRDDDAGVSEVQAWAWDQQTNTRSTRSFIQPHQRMKGKERQNLVDLNDIYLTNQNTGARAVRECVASVLPDWFIAEAQAVCEATLQNGEGKSPEERSREAATAFGNQGVTRAQLEGYVGAKFGKWTPAMLADLQRVYVSITQDGIAPSEFFTAAPVAVHPEAPAATSAPAAATPPAEAADPESAAESEPEAPADPTPQPAVDTVSPAQVTAIYAGMRGLGYDRDSAKDVAAQLIKHPIDSMKDLTKAEASTVLDAIEKRTQAAQAQAEPESFPNDEYSEQLPVDGGAA